MQQSLVADGRACYHGLKRCRKGIQNSTKSLTGADGEGITAYEYGDFGETSVLGETGTKNEVCYTGGIYDAATGLYYLNARYYDPEEGRFLTQDTFERRN